MIRAAITPGRVASNSSARLMGSTLPAISEEECGSGCGTVIRGGGASQAATRPDVVANKHRSADRLRSMTGRDFGRTIMSATVRLIKRGSVHHQLVFSKLP